MSKKIMVVGNKFVNFTQHENVVTVGQLEMLTNNSSNIISDETEFIPGQGICQDSLKTMFKNSGANEKIKLSSLVDFAKGKRNSYSHKKLRNNTLIGQCSQKSNNIFSLPLVINENCELMSDHQTGQHIQGMILVEASRQAFIAVTEEYFMVKSRGESYYVINNMNIDFNNFMFPLPATIHYEVIEKDINERRARFYATVSVIQNKKICSSMSVRFTVYPSEVISSKESNLAGTALSSVLNSYGMGNLQ